MALHLKELSAKGVEDFNPIPGEGVTGCADVVRLGRRLGHEYIVLEAENLAIPYDRISGRLTRRGLSQSVD